MKNIYYIGFYSITEQEIGKENRTFSAAAVYLMDFISETLAEKYHITILSPSWSLNSKGLYSTKTLKIKENITLILAPSFGSVSRVGKFISKLFSQVWLLFKIFSCIKTRDKILVYHSIANSTVLLITKKIIGFELILQLNEVYQNVNSQGLILNYFEKKIISNSDSYILSTRQLLKTINRSDKKSIICEGVMKMNTIRFDKFDDGKIHLVYAGLIDYDKLCAFNAINIANYLSGNYVMHIAGFGNQSDVNDLKYLIEKINSYGNCQIIFEGFLQGENLVSLLQQCHIGLVAQSNDKEFTETSFPSKIYTYLTNSLIVVSLYNNLISSSPIYKLLFTYKDNNPEKIAEFINSIDISKIEFEYYNSYINSICKNFSVELADLFYRKYI